MNRQRGMSSLALVLLLLVLGTLILTGLNQQLQTFSTLVSGESLSVRQQAASAICTGVGARSGMGFTARGSVQTDTTFAGLYKAVWGACVAYCQQ